MRMGLQDCREVYIRRGPAPSVPIVTICPPEPPTSREESATLCTRYLCAKHRFSILRSLNHGSTSNLEGTPCKRNPLADLLHL